MGNLACKASTNSWRCSKAAIGLRSHKLSVQCAAKKNIIGNCNHVYWVPTKRSGSCKRYVWVFLRVSWRCSVCWWLSFRGKGFTALRSSSPDEDKMKMLICPNHFQQCCIAPKWSKCSKKYHGKYRAKPVLVYPKVDWFLVAWLSNHFGMVIFPLFVASPWKSHWSFWLRLLLVDRSPSLGELRPWLKPPWRSAPTAWQKGWTVTHHRRGLGTIFLGIPPFWGWMPSRSATSQRLHRHLPSAATRLRKMLPKRWPDKA